MIDKSAFQILYLGIINLIYIFLLNIMDGLSRELLTVILSNIDIWNYYNVSLVCKRFYNTVNSGYFTLIWQYGELFADMKANGRKSTDSKVKICIKHGDINLMKRFIDKIIYDADIAKRYGFDDGIVSHYAIENLFIERVVDDKFISEPLSAYFTDAMDRYYRNYIREAALHGHINIINYFAEFHSINTQYDCFASACVSGNMPLVKLMSKKCLHVPWHLGLSLASENGHIDVIKYILGSGITSAYVPHSELVRAATHGHIELVKYLRELGAIFPMKKIATVIMNGHYEIARLLLEESDDCLNNSLKHMLENDHYEFARRVCIKYNEGRSEILFHLTFSDRMDIIEYLMNFGFGDRDEYIKLALTSRNVELMRLVAKKFHE